MSKEKQEYWSIDDLVELTDNVQEKEVEFREKMVKFQWCELVESEEPKFDLDETLTEEEKQEQYLKIGKERCLAMIAKATEKDSDYIGISKEQWVKLPSTLKYKVQNTLMGVQISDFQSG